MRLPLSFWLVGFFSLCLGVRGAAETLRIVAFGDSTTAPRGTMAVYATLLERELNRADGSAVEVVNAGKSGNTTAIARRRFEADVLMRAPAVVIVQFGINDSMVDVWKTPPANSPRVSLEDYRTNLRHFVAASRAVGAKVILMTPNPLRWTPGMVTKYGRAPYDPAVPEGFNVVVARYAEAVRALAAELDAPLVDVARAFEDAEAIDALLLDGMHPNQAGHDLVARLLAEQLRREAVVAAKGNSA